MEEQKVFIAQGCNMKEGGECNCGPNCPCNHCPTHTKPKESGLSRNTAVRPNGSVEGTKCNAVGSSSQLEPTTQERVPPSVCTKCGGPCQCTTDTTRQG